MTIQSRLARLVPRFPEQEVDGLLVSQGRNRRYLSGFTGSAGYLLITPKERILATDFRYLEQAAIQAPDYRIFKLYGDVADWFPRLADGLGLKRLGFEAGDVSFSFYRKLTEALAKSGEAPRLVPLEGLVESLRMVKEPEEMALIERAVAISDAAFEHAMSLIRPGMTELALAWEIEKSMREQNSEPLPFAPIVTSADMAALPHARPLAREFRPGVPIVIDIGARVEGYGSDLTRTICLGKPDEQFARVYDTVLGAQLTAIALIKEGMTGEEADRLARTVIEEAGFGEAFGHSLGHGVGLAPHEAPRLGPRSTDKLENGMVFSVEPGIYLSGWGGVRIEDLAVMENGKLRVMSKARKV
jgi:Xaa-Pro aminopeptidase